MRSVLVSRGVDPDRAVVEGDAVDLPRFSAMPSKYAARASFRLPQDRPFVGYVGRLRTMEREKGVGDMLSALRCLEREGRKVTGFIVGGPEDARRAYEKKARSLGLADVRFTGDIPAARVPSALAACDLLVMPFPDLPHYRTNMSPLKMFEYMAAERPIVTSDLPTIRDVLDEEAAYFCVPGDAESLARAIARALDRPDEAGAKAKAARRRVGEHTWEKRMGRILNAAPWDSVMVF